MEEQKNEAPTNPQNSEGAILNEQYKDKDFTSLLEDEFEAKTKQANEIQIPFPVTSLPEPLLSFVKEVSDVYSVPPEFPACAVLGAVSAAIQKKIHLHILHLRLYQSHSPGCPLCCQWQHSPCTD